MHEVAGIGGKRGIAAGQLDTPAATLERKQVANVDGVQDRFQFVKTVRSFPEDVQQEVNLAGRVFFQCHRASLSKN
jgi:hypothetical protein